jgi:alpha-beta hydrolase superfamily lysophospholipase
MSTTGSVEVSLDWSGDFQYDSTGDLILAVDTTDAPTATNQRLIRLILTAPNIVVNGQPVAFADDIFHPTWGAGLRAYVDDTFNATTLQKLTNHIMQMLSADPAVAASPRPTVTSNMVGPNAATVAITYTDTLGQKQVLPTINLSPRTVTVGS